jgi:hypothetical protein
VNFAKFNATVAAIAISVHRDLEAAVTGDLHRFGRQTGIDPAGNSEGVDPTGCDKLTRRANFHLTRRANHL